MTKIAGKNKSREERQDQGKRERKRYLLDLESVLKTGPGRRVLMEILGRANVFTECNTGNSQTFYLLGRRAVGISLMDDIGEVSPGELHKLLGEYYERRNKSNRTD